MEKRTVVIGAGPAGLTAAYELTQLGMPPVVVEKAGDVGGLACTVDYKGFHFDMGGHRFFTKVAPVAAMWRRVLGESFLRRPRLSRIYYDGKFFHYPLKPWNALTGLGVFHAAAIAASYLRWQVLPHRTEDTFEQWVTNRFGRRLFRTFFKTYTEKVWGISCSELKAEWAAQRIKDLSLRTAVLSMFLRPRTTIKTLIEEFDYPRLGPGMMWRAVRDAVVGGGGTVLLDTDVVAIHRDGQRIASVTVASNGRRETIAATDFVSSMPLTELIAKLDPPAPPEVRAAARRFSYRDFITVCLIVNRRDLFPDNWIYVHDPHVKVGRIQNYGNWSPAMVGDDAKTGLGLEYFCSEGDALWQSADADLIALATRELGAIGLAAEGDVEDGCVIRVPKAYPVYDSTYREHLTVVRGFVDGLANLQTIGRNGLHRYDNQDHAMLTGMLAVRNLAFGERNDLWSVNTEPEYHEEVRTDAAEADGEVEALLDGALTRVFAKLDRVALGVAVGSVSGAALALASLALVLKGGPVVGPHLRLLSQYLPGYEASLRGALLGLGYGLACGFATGWLLAVVRNAVSLFYLSTIRRRAEYRELGRLLDYI